MSAPTKKLHDIADYAAIFTARKRSLRQGNVFTDVCTGLCMMLPGPMFLPGGLCFWSHVPSRGFLSRGGGLCPGEGVSL